MKLALFVLTIVVALVLCLVISINFPKQSMGRVDHAVAYVLIPLDIPRYQSEPWWIENSRSSTAHIEVASKSCSCVDVKGVKASLLSGERIPIQLSAVPQAGARTITADLRLKWNNDAYMTIKLAQVVVGVPRLVVEPDILSLGPGEHRKAVVVYRDENRRRVESSEIECDLPKGVSLRSRVRVPSKLNAAGFWETGWRLTFEAEEDYLNSTNLGSIATLRVSSQFGEAVSEQLLVRSRPRGVAAYPSQVIAPVGVERLVRVLSRDDVAFSVQKECVVSLDGISDTSGVVVECDKGIMRRHLIRVVHQRTSEMSKYEVRLRTTHPDAPHVSFTVFAIGDATDGG